MNRKKISSALNYIIIIFTFGCVNKNKNINEDILIKNNELNKLLSDKIIINNEKQLLEQEIRKIKFNKARIINVMDLKNKQSASGYKPSNSSCI